MRVVVETKNMSREDWIQERKNGIGGSDASAIVGANKYKSPIVLYMEKIGAYEQPVAGEAAYWGTALEDIVAQEFIKRYNEELRNKWLEENFPPSSELPFGMEDFKPAKIQRRNAILAHDEHDWMLANLDRLLFCPVRGKGLLEVKTASSYVAEEWKGEDVPNAYFVQVQHYLAVTGYAYAFVAVLIGGNQFKYYYIPRDEAFIADLIILEKHFWENHVLAKIPPTVDGSDATQEMYKILYPQHYEGTVIELGNEAEQWAVLQKVFKRQKDDAETNKKEMENKIKDAMKENETAFAGPHKITWKTNKKGVRTLLIKLGDE